MAKKKRSSTGLTLCPTHKQHFTKSGFDCTYLLDEAHVHSCTGNVAQHLGRGDDLGSGVIFPYWEINERPTPIMMSKSGKGKPYVSARLDTPIDRESGPMKYVRPAKDYCGLDTPLYVPIRSATSGDAWEDSSVPIFFVEGEKKACMLDQNDCLTIAGAGVNMFHIPETFELRQLKVNINWKQRTCYICFDNDIVRNPHVDYAAQYLASVIYKLGGIPHVVYIPHDLPSGTGVDDFIGDYGFQEFTKLTNSAKVRAPKKLKGMTGISGMMASAVIGAGRLRADYGGTVYQYSDGFYQPARPHDYCSIFNELDGQPDMADYATNSPTVARIIQAVSLNSLDHKPLDGLVPLQNGLYDLDTMRMRPHSPTYETTYQMNVEYDPDAECRQLDLFLHQVFKNNQDIVELMYELLGTLFVPLIPSTYITIMYGTGGNGKSILLDFTKNLLREANVQYLPIQSLDKQRDQFGTAGLGNKLLIVCPDLPNNKIQDLSTAKAITSHEPIVINEKFQQAYTAVCYSRIFIAANQLPRVADVDEGTRRRLIMLPFEVDFTKHKDRKAPRELMRLLNTPYQRSGLFNRVLPRLCEWYANDKIELTLPQEVIDLREETLEFSDEIKHFMQRKFKVDAKARMKRVDIYNLYAREPNIRKPITRKEFYKRLQTLGYKQVRINGLNHFCVRKSFQG